MSKVICIAGESGSGKTTAMRNLDPGTTYYVDADGKGLSWKGWKDQYNPGNRNYLKTDHVDKVRRLLEMIKNNPDKGYRVIVIDTINSLMVADEMRRAKEKGYDKWMDLAACVWDLINDAYTLPDDITVIFVAHTQTERDESGYEFTRIKTSGKKLGKIDLESRFTTVLIAKEMDGKYVFQTHAHNSTAKTPLGAFTEDEVENDIVKVLESLKDF